MPTFTTTAKHALRKLTGANFVSDIDAGFTALASDLDAIIARADQGPAGSRPTSTGGTPGKLGRFYWATDTLVLSFDYGTGWVTVYEDQAWHVIGATGEPAYGGSAATVGPAFAPQIPAAFYRSGGRVHLRGRVTVTGVIFTLPVGCRPADTLVFDCPRLDAAGSARVTVTAAGLVSGGAGGVSLALDAISFRAEQ